MLENDTWGLENGSQLWRCIPCFFRQAVQNLQFDDWDDVCGTLRQYMRQASDVPAGFDLDGTVHHRFIPLPSASVSAIPNPFHTQVRSIRSAVDELLAHPHLQVPKPPLSKDPHVVEAEWPCGKKCRACCSQCGELRNMRWFCKGPRRLCEQCHSNRHLYPGSSSLGTCDTPPPKRTRSGR